jgi:hypothetical protein
VDARQLVSAAGRGGGFGRAQAEAQMDAIMDGLRDAFTLAYHAANAVSISAQSLAQDVDLPELGVPYLANVIGIVSTIAEGRT